MDKLARFCTPRCLLYYVSPFLLWGIRILWRLWCNVRYVLDPTVAL